MFDNRKYRVTVEFQNVDDLREWLRVDGTLRFFVDGRYYFLDSSWADVGAAKPVRWYYVLRGDFRDVPYADDEKILFEFYDFDQIWRAPVFGDGKSFERNFDEFVFYD